MKDRITYDDLVAMNPCYRPEEIGIKKGFKMSIREFVNEYRSKVKKKEDIIWVLCRSDYMSDKDMILFSVWCAREALKLIDKPDPRSLNACDVVERYANGKAGKYELCAARTAAMDALWGATSDAYLNAARAAAQVTMLINPWRSATSAAMSTGDAARDAQINKLLTYFND